MVVTITRKRILVRLAVLGVALFLVVLVIASPFALDTFRGDDLGWQRRSIFGQTY